jgi:hypothetical protein
MKLTYKEILTLRAALLSLDGLDQSVEVKGGAQIIKKPFKFAGATRLKIARNLRAAEAAFEDYDAARVGLVREISDGGEQVPEAKVGEFSRRLADLLQEEVEAPVAPFAEDELNLDDNEIPHGALAVLLGYVAEQAN